jgi:hypothetical protein
LLSHPADFHHAMTIGIGFDHREDGNASQIPKSPDIIANRPKIDLEPGHHFRIIHG